MCARLDGLTEFEVATGQRPGSRAVRAKSLTEQHAPIALDDDADADTRMRDGHG